MKEQQFPPIQGGGSLMLAWQVKGKHVLVIGGGEVGRALYPKPRPSQKLISRFQPQVAAGRILSVLNADARVTVISPPQGLSAEVAHRIATLPPSALMHVPRAFQPTDLDDPTVAMVLCAIDDPAASSTVYKLCKEKRIPANIADVPPECDFYFGSVHRDGPLQVMVSTNGNGPKLANIVRRRIAAALPGNIGAAVVKVGMLRRRLRRVAPAPEEGQKRMQWMSRVCERWSLEDLCDMSEKDAEALLDYYTAGEVPSLGEVRLGMDDRGGGGEGTFGFDGSFGWM